MAKFRLKKHVSLDIEICITHDISYPEWILLAQIEFLSARHGYCYAKRKTLAEALMITERGLRKMIHRMQDKQLLEVLANNNLRVTEKWMEMQQTKGEQSSGTEEEQSSGRNGNKVPVEEEQSSGPTIKRENEGSKGSNNNTSQGFNFSLSKPTPFNQLSYIYHGELAAYAESYTENGLDLFQAMVDFHTAKGSSFKDWAAAFRTWVRNDRKFTPRARTATMQQEFKNFMEMKEHLAANFENYKHLDIEFEGHTWKIGKTGVPYSKTNVDDMEFDQRKRFWIYMINHTELLEVAA